MQRPHMLNRIPAVYLCIDRALMTGHVCGVLHGVRGCMPPSVSETGQSHEIEVDVSLPQLVSGGTQLTHPIHPLRPACPPTTPLAIRLSPLTVVCPPPPRLQDEVGCEDICSFEPEVDECAGEEECELELEPYSSKQDFFRATAVGLGLLVRPCSLHEREGERERQAGYHHVRFVPAHPLPPR
jgi:hypothetical protein